tara:strand:- start:499 stop:846 length:348 start_codon:yes stop_codon:yes gene_type:complete
MKDNDTDYRHCISTVFDTLMNSGPRYTVPLKGKEIINDGKVRIMIDFPSIAAAADFAAHTGLDSALFMEDGLTESSVAEDRKFILRHTGDMPEEFQLHKISVTSRAVGGKLDETI